MKARYLFLLIIFSAFSLISTAQEIGFPVIRNYTPKEYNNSSQVWSIIQSHTGIMYFGVGGTVMEYDGIFWRNIPIDKQSSPRDFAMDKNGRIYVAASEEFGYLTKDRKNSTIYQSLTPLLKDSTLKIGIVWSVKLTSGFIYFRTNDAIFLYTSKPETLQIFKADANDKFDGDFIYQDRYYVKLAKKGLMKIEDNKLKPATQSVFFKNINNFNLTLPYNATTLLIPTRYEGLYLFQPSKDTLPQKFTISDKNFTADNTIYSASIFQKKYFVLGSITKGALLFDKQGVVLQHYQESNTLQNNKVYEIATDASQNVWFGLSNGISKTEHGQDLSSWDKKNTVYSVIRHNNTIYIATGIKVYFIDKDNQTREVKNIPTGQNWCFLKPKGIKSLLVGTSKGIYEIFGDKAEQIYKGEHIYKLYQSIKHPNRILSTDYPYFISIKYEKGKWIPEGKWEGINDNIRGIIEDERGEIWISTYQNGVIKITPNNENITTPSKVRYYTKNAGFKLIKNILPFSFKGRIIWGTENGLYSYNLQNDSFEPFCDLGEQFCNGSRGVYSLAEMPDGKIWVCPRDNSKTDIGYLQPNGKGGYDWVYAPFRRIPNMFLEACYIEPSGIAWIGGSEGVYRYDATKDTKNYAQQFNCLIRKVTIGRDSLLYGGNASATLAGLQTQLDYQFNSLRFEFAA
ncbi:MAG: hypothetical protein EHM93_20155, partial [Bacteroidales bacterium]